MKMLRRDKTLHLQLDTEDPGIVLMAIARVAFGLFSYPLTVQPGDPPITAPPELPSDVAHSLIVHTIEDRLGFNPFAYDNRQCMISAQQQAGNTIVVGRSMSDAILGMFLTDLTRMIAEASASSESAAHMEV
ncbi:MAG: hypothetical protein V1907_04400 [Candidatus Kerfeldbacteria bacterium]